MDHTLEGKSSEDKVFVVPPLFGAFGFIETKSSLRMASTHN